MSDINNNMESGEDLSTEELIYENSFLINALVDTLVQKGLFTEDEFMANYEKILAEAESNS